VNDNRTILALRQSHSVKNFRHSDKNLYITPTKVGIQIFQPMMDSYLRRNNIH